MQLTGAQIVIECLKEQNVDTVFGYPGGSILNVYDELYKHRDEIRHVLTSHEQGASHAADGYARSTRQGGRLFCHQRARGHQPGNGNRDGLHGFRPVVAITCNVGVSLLGKDSFQEVDIAGITMPITKHNFIVKDVNRLADTIRRAFTIARTGRPGPVLVDIPKDVTAAKAEYEFMPAKPVERISDTITQEALEKAAELIRAAKKPYIMVGAAPPFPGLRQN